VQPEKVYQFPRTSGLHRDENAKIKEEKGVKTCRQFAYKPWFVSGLRFSDAVTAVGQ